MQLHDYNVVTGAQIGGIHFFKLDLMFSELCNFEIRQKKRQYSSFNILLQCISVFLPMYHYNWFHTCTLVGRVM